MKSNTQLVKDYFKKNLPDYELVLEAFAEDHWALKFAKEKIEVIVTGDVGFMIEVFFDTVKYDLRQHNPTLVEKVKANEKNILARLEVISGFLKG